MAVEQDNTLRALIRLIPPVQALKDEAEKSLQLEIFHGVGDAGVRSYSGLQASVARLSDDPYVQALAIDVPDGANDKQKVSLVLLLSSQLLAYLQGQTGLAGVGGKSGNNNYHTAPTLNFNSVHGVSQSALDRAVEAGANAVDAQAARRSGATE